MDKFIELYNNNYYLNEMNSTNKVNGSYFKDGFISEKYRDKTEQFSKSFTWKINQRKIQEIKSKFKHKKTPTEIIIIIDSFAFSAASKFMKNVYKNGAVIKGNPYLSDVFDINQSPSAVLGVGGYQYMSINCKKNS